MEIDNIQEAVLSKARQEAGEIISEAELKGQALIEKAKKQKQQETERKSGQILQNARRESSKVTAQALLSARQELSRAKDDIINSIMENVSETLRRSRPDRETLRRLIAETINALENENRLRIFAAPEDIEDVREIIEADGSLREKIAEVLKTDSLGGIVAESMNGMISIDNRYETRIEMLMPKILPELAKILFGAQEQ